MRIRTFSKAAFAFTSFPSKKIINSAQHHHHHLINSIGHHLPPSRKLSTTRIPKMSNEVKAAAKATPTSSEPTIFDKLIDGAIPCTKVYEDDKCLAFHDVAPQAPIHLVLIPKRKDGLDQISNGLERHKDILGHLMYTAGQIGKVECPGGFRIVVNDGKEGAQSVYHLHLHILGGRQMNWPPG